MCVCVCVFVCLCIENLSWCSMLISRSFSPVIFRMKVKLEVKQRKEAALRKEGYEQRNK